MSHKAKSAKSELINNTIVNNLNQEDMDNKSKDSYSAINERSYSFKNDIIIPQSDNLKNILALKNNLNPKINDDKIIIKDIETFFTYSSIYENRFSSPNFNNSNFNDQIFENKVNEILIKKLNLEAFDYFPIFKIYNSQKGKTISCLSYFKIKIKEEEENEPKEFYYLSNKNYIYLSFKDFIIVIEIYNNKLENITISKNDFNKKK